MSAYDTVLFDLDGTLLNTLDDLRDSVNFILERYGCPTWEGAEIRPFLGNGIRRLMELAVPGGAEHPRFKEMFEEFRVYYTAHCEQKTRPYPGVEELLRELKERGLRMAVVSNKNHEAVEELGRRFFPCLSVCVGQQEGLRRKPAPDMAESAMKALGAARDRTVYVGDSEVDFQTAQNAELPCILVSWGFRDRREIEALHPAALVDDPQMLLKELTR
ncbi:HAD-IIIA family hydrolase [Oscillibacter sp. MSJ-2]|uniref:HAD-IIIA family hydrolase n=1 Tax=Dysosmobacter acutus TaxID=2841504 RepID=A0ABS6FC28_9FIRM|nr:HAD-IIIA family hydrolase [Dysosmobacter acutus]MBU5627840.1 HAD-IIIA family hydrolase [Dysosmobacter acutus]